MGHLRAECVLSACGLRVAYELRLRINRVMIV